ncbi:zinc finger and SCAN domain-containing protein 21 isoform X2 [Nothobranchius furzeri]|uniref:Zinc finger protein 397-like n=1 Tax=Nothobranchius furzeri TaxID=105023 RepID=A0A1A8U5S9_NOTFU|nr:zinc finger protein 397 isoform X2 [Nothobranchius furzeri]KAF7208962.1 zinc finger protein 397-like [Nothobranchius furzeri]
MTKLELLNTFLNDRLTAAAGEIFRAVKAAVAEYQSELLRSREENERLRRLLDSAVQQLLQAEPSLSQEHSPFSDSNRKGSVELLSQAEENGKRRSVQTDGSPEERVSKEGNCSGVQQQRSQALPDSGGSLPSPTSVQIKKENAEDENEKRQQPVTVTSDCRAAQSFSPSFTSKSHKPFKPDHQGMELLCSNSKPNTHSLTIKNVRSLKRPLSRLSHPNQSMQRWHSCKECGKGFSFACQLEVHMRWHTKEKPYSCTVCRKSFTTVSMLKRHHRIHTGEKPFRCRVCGKCFNQSAHLNTHFRLHTREKASWS